MSYADSVYLPISGVLLLALVIIAFMLRRQREQAALLRQSDKLLGSMLSALRTDLSLEQVLADMMMPLAEIVPAQSYYFYTPDPKDDLLVLRAVLSTAVSGLEGPLYTNLLKYWRGDYSPPLTLQPNRQPRQAALISEGQFSLLALPVWKEERAAQQKKLVGTIIIGPVALVAPLKKRLLQHALDKIGSLVDLLNEHRLLRERYSSMDAIRQASASLPGTFAKDATATFLNLGMEMIQAGGGLLFCRHKDAEEPRLVAATDMDFHRYFRDNHSDSRALWSLVGEDRIDKGRCAVLNQGGAGFQSIPACLLQQGARTLICFSAHDALAKVLLVFYYTHEATLDKNQVAAVNLIAQRSAELISVSAYADEVSRDSLKSMKTQVESLELQDAMTMCSSSRVRRYAGVIAAGMGLPREEIENTMLAAYLRDLGMNMLRQSLLGKKGDFTKSDLEFLRLHTEVGSVLVASLSDSDQMALYIRHHHERWDGWGYPGRLKGSQIPLGARIIAVADTFNAMVSERPHRPAMTFEQAAKNLHAAAGSQLDPAVVAVLLDWFKTKQANASPNAPLEPCWEMQQCPSSYTESCPVFGTTARCWEEPDAWCKRQGQDCQTCLVYTEHLCRAGARTVRKARD